MKKHFTLLSIICVFTLFPLTQIVAQTDITKYFLSNYGFDENFNYDASSSTNVSQEILDIPSWTAGFNIDYTITGIYEFGFQGTFNSGTVPSTGYNNSEGGGLALSTGWNQTFTYTQQVTLPAGTYTINVPTYNGKNASGGTSALAWIPESGTSVTSSTSSFPYGEWTLDNITFTLSAITTGSIQIGYVAGSGGSANSANIIIDYVQIVGDNIDAKSLLLETINTAKTTYDDGTGKGASDLKSAYETAQSVYDNNEDDVIKVLDANLALIEAINTYNENNVSEEHPLDCTSYITNPNFESGTEGWDTENISSQTNTSFTMKSGSTYVEKWVSSGNAVGDASVSQTIELPVGKYKLIASAQNLNQSNTSQQCAGAYIYADDQQADVYTPADYTVVFTNINSSVEIGFKAVGATGNWLALDNFRLYLIGNIDLQDVINLLPDLISEANELLNKTMAKSAREALNQAVTNAQSVIDNKNESEATDAVNTIKQALSDAQISVNEYQDLLDAITNAELEYDEKLEGAENLLSEINIAKELYNNDEATSQALSDEIKALEKAILALHLSNATGSIPTVVTNPYVARGSKVAFGRLTTTSNGATISETGFCYSSENTDPTVLDDRSSLYYSHQGNIYCITDLSPATKYYVRAYAITSGYQVAYGDVVSFYTLPKPNCSWTWSECGISDVDSRCRAAVKDAIENYYNTCTGVTGFTLQGHYESSVATADCSYGGYMRFGPNSSYQATGTALHEANHGVGVGTTERWYSSADLRESTSSGYWRGRRANELVNFFENTSNNEVRVTGDGTHMWATHSGSGTSTLLAYGINGAQEDTSSPLQYYANVLVTQYLFEDGLCPTSSYHNGMACNTFDFDENKKYYIVCENADYGRDNNGFIHLGELNYLAWQPDVAISDSAAWYIEYAPSTGYYYFRNAENNKYMSHSSTMIDVKGSSKSSTEQFQLIPARSDVSIAAGTTKEYATYGYWFTWYDQSNKAMYAGELNSRGVNFINRTAFDFSDNASSQRWIFICEDELEAYQEAAIEAGIQSLREGNSIGSGNVKVVSIYNVDGTKLSQTEKGINIVKFSDGSTRKIVVR